MGSDSAKAGGLLAFLLLVMGAIAGSTDPTRITDMENVSFTQPSNSTFLPLINPSIFEVMNLSLTLETKTALWCQQADVGAAFYTFVGDAQFDLIVINAGYYNNDGSITTMLTTGWMDTFRAALKAINSNIKIFADIFSSSAYPLPSGKHLTLQHQVIVS